MKSSLSQRPGRKHQAVTVTAVVLDRYFKIARQRVMLQAVVQQQHASVWMGGEKGGARGRTVTTDPDRATASPR